jgi:hypothetical protein
MSSNPIILQVNDGIAPSIAPNLAAIEKNADSANGSLQALKQSLDALSNTGVGNLSRSLSVSANSTQKLAAATSQMAVAALTASQNVDKLAVSYVNLSTALGQAVSLLTTYGNVVQRANISSTPFVQTLKKTSSAGHGAVTDVMAASAAIRGLEGNFGTSVRAGERFLVNILGMGPILRAAFPIFGALAFMGVLDILGQHVNSLIEAFKRLKGAETDAEIAAIKAGDTILKVKGSGFFSAANFASLLSAGELSGTKSVEIDSAQAKLRELQYSRELLVANNEIAEKSLQGLALQKEKVKDLEAEKQIIEIQKQQVDNLFGSYEKLLTAQHKVSDGYTNPKTGITSPPEFVRNITDPKQIKEIEEQMRITKTASAELGHEIEMMGPKIKGALAKEPIIGLRDEFKLAREQMKQFELEFGKLKLQDHVVTPQEKVTLLKDQLQRALPTNVPALTNQLGNAEQEVLRANQIDIVIGKLKEENAQIGLYSDALKEAQQYEKLEAGFKKDHITLTDQQIAQIKSLIKTNVENVDYQRELKAVYDEFDGPLNKYNAALSAINKLQSDGAINSEQAKIALLEVKRTYDDTINPINEFNISLEHQSGLLDKYGTALKVATEVDSVRQSLQKKGRDLDESQIALLTQKLTQMDHQKLVQSELNSIWEKTVGTNDKLIAQQEALKTALDDSLISLGKYKQSMLEIAIEQDKVLNDSGKGDFSSHFRQMLAGMVDTSKSTAAQVTDIWKGFFTGLDNGFADSIGRWAVGLQSFKSAMLDVVRNGVSELIASFVKLGIEMLIIYSLEKMFPKLKVLFDAKPKDTTKDIAKNTAASIASIAAVGVAEYAMISTLMGPAWELAEAMSLISFGANAAGAVAGIAAVIAAGDSAKSNFGGFFATGGVVPGFGNRDNVLISTTPGEGILNTAAMNRLGASGLKALNSGAASVRAGSVSSGTTGMTVNVIHDGSTNVQVQRISETEVRVIAKQEADKAVQTKTQGIMSAALADPNSTVSKAVLRNTTAKRARG